MSTYEIQKISRKRSHQVISSAFSASMNSFRGILEKFQKIGHVKPITLEDQQLFHDFFCRIDSSNPSYYGNSWTYLTQAANGVHEKSPYPLGLRYCDGRLLVTIGFFARPLSQGKTYHFHLIRPIGNLRSEFPQLCQYAWELSKTPVYIKKLTDQQFLHLCDTRGFKRIDQYPWHEMACAEDDTHPEINLEIDHTLSYLCTRGQNELKDKFRRFQKRHFVQIIDYTIERKKEAMEIVDRFFKYKDDGTLQLSSADDYYNMLSYLPSGKNGEDYFATLFQVDRKWAGFYLAERLYPGIAAGVYANMALYKEFPYLSEYLILKLCERLQHAGIKIANLGGSETLGLHEFKMKFRPPSLSGQQKSHWLVYVGN